MILRNMYLRDDYPQKYGNQFQIFTDYVHIYYLVTVLIIGQEKKKYAK